MREKLILIFFRLTSNNTLFFGVVFKMLLALFLTSKYGVFFSLQEFMLWLQNDLDDQLNPRSTAVVVCAGWQGPDLCRRRTCSGRRAMDSVGVKSSRISETRVSCFFFRRLTSVFEAACSAYY
jgi:hypothetical protein